MTRHCFIIIQLLIWLCSIKIITSYINKVPKIPGIMVKDYKLSSSGISRSYSLSMSRLINPGVNTTSSRVQRIKDMSIQRQILTDITSAEFALRIELNNPNRQIDYNRLISKLDKNIYLLNEKPGIKDIASLKERLHKTKEDLELVNQGLLPKYTQSVTSDTTEVSSDGQINRLQELRESLPILVREDGTVDWDNALASSKEVAKFGAELWERVNGKKEGLPSLSELFGEVQVPELQTETISELKNKLEEAKMSLMSTIRSRDNLKNTIRQLRKDGVSIPEDNVKLLLSLDLRVKELEKYMKIVTVDFDLERMCLYLEQEIESSSISSYPFEQKQFIAEIALLDKQYAGLISNLSLQFYSILKETDNVITKEKGDEIMSLIDDDELNLISNEVVDLKNRLGLDTQSVFDWGSFGVIVSDNFNKIKTGLSFYGDGIKLLIRDIRYAWSLLVKAALGNILKPREVNAIRRTGKDLFTLIPFTIILIIPLTPVGHVLAFTLIQKFLPDFYPSFFTEKRQNLKKIFSEIENKGDSELDEILSREDTDVIFKSDDTSGGSIITNFSETMRNILDKLKVSFTMSNDQSVIEK